MLTSKTIPEITENRTEVCGCMESCNKFVLMHPLSVVPVFLSHGTILPSGSVTLVSSDVWQKLPGKPKLPKVSTYMIARFRT